VVFDASLRQTSVIDSRYAVNRFLPFDHEYLLAVADSGRIMAISLANKEVVSNYHCEGIE